MTLVTKCGFGLMVAAIAIDPTAISVAAVTVIVSLTGATVTIIGALTAAKKELLKKADAISLAAIAAGNEDAEKLAKKVASTESKLDAMKQTGEESAVKVDGNLHAVQEQLKVMTAHSRSLEDTVATLTGIIQSRQFVVTATPATPPSGATP